MDKTKKVTLVSLGLYFFFCTLVTLSELPMVTGGQRLTFALLKFTCVWLTAPYAYCVYRDIRPRIMTIVAAVSMLAYACVGQYYRPLYYLGFFQVCFMIAVILPMDKKTFRIILGLGTAVFMTVFFSHWDQFVIQSQSPVKSDMVFAIFAVAILGGLANTFFSSERSFHQNALARFSQIGLHSARVIHDLKGLIGAPHLHIQYLRSKDSQSLSFEETQEILQLIARDLDGLKNTLIELNILSAPAQMQQEWLDLGEILDSVEMLLSKQKQGIQINRVGTGLFKADRSTLTSILVNLFLNSIQNFSAMKTEHPEISVVIEADQIAVIDNGGGFTPEILKSFANGHFYSTRENGSGLGLMLISEGVKKLNGKVLVENSNGGSRVSLKFPASLFRIKKLPAKV